MLGKSFSRIQSAALAYAILTVAADAADDLDCFDIGSAPDYNLDECAFAQKYCTDNVYSRTYYCSSGVGRGFFVAACVGWLGLLFVLLGSTIEFVHLNLTQADDYFSPALEQFSVKLGLPPRFAGVTLLALGNGAPDVSSTIASITAGGDGYLLSLGALTGAGMFVGTVVAGSVILAVGGVHARGAMIRDCTAYLATCCMVLYIFSSGDVSHGDVTLLLICYFAFIGTVLAADIYHRAVVLPRQKLLHDFMAGGLAAGTSSSSIDRGFEMGSAIRQLENLRPGFENAGSGGDTVAMRTADDHGPSSPVSAAPTPPSRATTDATPSGRAQNAHAPIAHARNKGGLLEGVTNKRAKYVIMHADDDDYEDADLDFAGLGGRELELDGYSTLEGSRHDEFKDLPSFAGEESGGYNNEPELSVVERFREKVSGGLEEFNEMSPSDKFLYLVEWPFTVARRFTVPITADDNYVKPYLILSVALMPLWFVGYYMDMATSMIGGSSSSRDDTRDDYDDPASPIDDANYDDGDDGSRALFTTRALGLSGPRTLNSRLLSATRQLSNESGDGGGFPVLLLAMMISCTAAAALYFKCSDSRPPPTIIAAPLALVGFAVAATWIDTIAGNLVSTLGFLGMLLNIPQPVLGLTVLAWGNSIGDYATNMAMARKGLSNMAMTACFAGPVFNMLIGIGAGFGVLLSSDDTGVAKNGTFAVDLSPGIIAGFVFIIVNCAAVAAFGVFNKNFVPKGYGRVSTGLYCVYLVTSFLLLFEVI